MNNSYITIIKEKRTVLSRKRVPLNQNECTADFRIGVPFEQNLQSVDVSVDSASGTYLFKDIDYTLTYKNNINVGTATVIIKGKGTYSGSLKLNFKIQLRKPVLKSVKKSGSTDVKLTWKKTTGATGYEIYRTSGNSWKKIASVNSTSYTDRKLEKGTLYKYKIRAYKNVNGKKQYSEYSPQKSVKR